MSVGFPDRVDWHEIGSLPPHSNRSHLGDSKKKAQNLRPITSTNEHMPRTPQASLCICLSHQTLGFFFRALDFRGLYFEHVRLAGHHRPTGTMKSANHRWCQYPDFREFLLLALGGPVGLATLAWGDEAVLALGGGTTSLLCLYLAGFAAICLGVASPLVFLPGKMGGHALGIGMLLLMISTKPLLGDLHQIAEQKVQKAITLAKSH